MDKNHGSLICIVLVLCVIIVALSLSTSLFNIDTVTRQEDPGVESAGTASPGPSEKPFRRIPPFHILAAGETVSEIAALYGISLGELIHFNRITDVRVLTPGDRILLPGGIQQLRNVSLPGDRPRSGPILPRAVTIQSRARDGFPPLQADFSPVVNLPDSLTFVWDFGNGIYAFTEQAGITYLKPGDFAVNLTVMDNRGAEVISNTIIVSVYGDENQDGEDIFLTADHVNQQVNLAGLFHDAAGAPVLFDESFRLEQDPPLLAYLEENRFLAKRPGYTKVVLASDSASYRFYLFVSPFPSQHSLEPLYDWYKTQFDTGMYGNCGPACVAMAVHWATGKAISVVESREEIGMPIKSGAISLQHMRTNFDRHDMQSRLTPVSCFEDIRAIIDRGGIFIILFDTTYIQPVSGDETMVFVDRYYPDTTGHYVVIKGYSLDGKYCIVYDPIPGDWKTNSLRYTDGYSMIGRNRYFLTSQVLESLKSSDVLEVRRRKNRDPAD